MPIFIIIALDIVITLHFSINCSTIICSPTICFLSREKPLVKPMAPGSIFHHIFFRFINQKYQKIPCCNLFFYFVLHFSNLLYLPPSDLILASDREGIVNSFIALGASVWLFVQVHRLETCVYLLLDWSFLQWEKYLALGSMLRCPFSVSVGAARQILYCCLQG